MHRNVFCFQEVKLSNSIEERVRNTTDRVEHITTKMEDLNQKANCQIQSVQVSTKTFLSCYLRRNDQNLCPEISISIITDLSF